MRKLFMTTTAAAIALAGAAQAQTMATAGTDLNVRSGPGVQNEVIGSIKSGGGLTIRDAESALRDAGFSSNEAKAIVAKGFTAIDHREGDDQLQRLQNLMVEPANRAAKGVDAAMRGLALLESKSAPEAAIIEAREHLARFESNRPVRAN
jgi:hypothetical protein